MYDGTEIIGALVIRAIFGGIIAAIASSKGRNTVGWFFIGLLVPCIGLIIILCLSNLQEENRIHSMQASTNQRLQEQLRQERMKNQAFQQHTAARLDRHDNALQLDTRQVSTAIAGPLPTAIAQANTPALASPEAEWYFSADGEKNGPHPISRMQQLIGTGVIRRETLVWDPTASAWVEAGTVTALSSHFF